ncbi:helix-turn-helix domain-containing protein [Myxococcaceae bacterium JPH2]|nr:helix-turn-helix domain-containing protein [Myxococcaceae bacterium JPH2]
MQELGHPLSLPAVPLMGTCIILPRDVMTRLLPDADSQHGRWIVGGMARLFSEHVRSLLCSVPELTIHDAPQFARATQQMVAACLATMHDSLAAARPQLHAALATQARRYIEKNLMAPDLSAQRLGAALGLSRSVLYQLFESAHGVARSIQGRRLERTHAVLCDPTEHRRIADIADEHGLPNEAHFSRAFRRRFGCSAKDVRGARVGRLLQGSARVPTPCAGSAHLGFAGWVKQLRAS